MKIKNVCIVDTMYSLSMYLLRMDDEDIQNTAFFVGDAISEEVSSKLPICYRIEDSFHLDWKRLLNIKIKRYLKWRFLLTANIYSQDHIAFGPVLIGWRNYTLIADGPTYHLVDKVSFLKPFTPNTGDTLKRKIKYWLTYCSVYGKTFGTNKQCVNRWFTDEKDENSPYIKGKNCELFDLYHQWETASKWKKTFIMNAFSISESILSLCKEVDILLLTQPLMNDCHLTEQEVIDVYGPSIANYEHVVVKPHPRDKFDYNKYFPKVEILKTKAPMQLLNYMGLEPAVAVTVSSSSISSMLSSTKCIILGTLINPKIRAVYGEVRTSVIK